MDICDTKPLARPVQELKRVDRSQPEKSPIESAGLDQVWMAGKEGRFQGTKTSRRRSDHPHIRHIIKPGPLTLAGHATWERLSF
jgi:hypothetical protein